ncbi:MAG: phosphate ABC transporter permease subunit PstC [Acidimicrobiales bacterium]|nr:phosphate ABC transporter permease subunit PstC [Acidimicrobiales bacterium]
MTDASLAPPRKITLDDLRGESHRMRKEGIVKVVFLAAAVVSIVISALIIFSLVREAWTFMSKVEWKTLWSEGWFPRRNLFDVKTLFVGTLLTTAVAMVVATPLGLGAAVYLSEYANPRVRKVLKPVLEILAGIPSVVLGFFALTFIAPEILQKIFDGTPQSTLLAAGIGVGILTIPLVAAISEDALRSVPHALREASAGMGARKVTTTIKVVIPAAISGLVAALIVAISRAIGETMVVFIAAGGSGGSLFNTDLLEPGTTMTAAMASQAAGSDAVAGAELAFASLFFVGLLLFVVTFTLNLIAGGFVHRVRQQY